MLFTGSGRHRRQGPAEKAAERAIAAAGVAGVGIALPLLAVAGAHAAPSAVWDRVADCESGGNWSSDAGNGGYGGLGITAQRWNDYGGTQYSALPNGATRSQQIAVAERILATEGPSPWSACADDAGLNTASAPGVVDDNDSADETGSLRGARGVAAVNAAPDGSTVPDGRGAPVFSGLPGYDPVSHVYWYEKNGAWFWTSHQSLYERYMQLTHPQPHPSAPTTTTPDPTVPTPNAPDAPATPTVPPVSPTDPAAPGDPTDPTASPSPSTPTDGGTGTNDGNGGGLLPTLPVTPSPGPSTGTGDTPEASPSGGTTTAPSAGSGTTAPTGASTAPAAPTTSTAPAPAASPSAQPYTVGPGDTLASIARSNAVGGGWSELYRSNQQLIGENPDLIRPGQVLDLG
ncbi:LysM domain-containing protein [Kitasatospora sp. SolWspMP-SS2h]|uniref:LysM peptidoglycan-binding domain-containing protein n=1 Tax=Kitasatospora sp. SolWspMP-SS2h TaxID=1305729 RepID=UPI000DBA3610|nr:transglycosylase family protein [Kitasatospora sp. SolWspMP-SS2h]RAJ36901.1 LysM domain-containing protein [Kitasatospora sp. SolWspMP-SS2h]